MPTIKINDITITIERKRIKSLRLAVCPPAGHVKMSVPFHVGDDAINSFIMSKLSWAKKHITKFEQRQAPKLEYKTGAIHYFQGQSYLLHIVHCRQNMVVIRNNKCIELYTTTNIFAHNYQDRCKRVMDNWYKEQLHKLIPGYINKWEKIINVKVSGYGIKQMKTRWGSCNISRCYIWLNLELAKKSLDCLEYVIVRELVHMLERKRNQKFIKHMDSFMPK